MAELSADAVLIDIDGVLVTSWKPIPGAAEALSAIREAGLPVALLTNTTSKPRSEIVRLLGGAGFDVGDDDVLTAPVLTGRYLAEHHSGDRVRLLNDGDLAGDLGGLELVRGTDERADVVLLGGGGPDFGYANLNAAFADLQAGGALLAMNRNLYWRTDGGRELDTGAFLLGLERAADREATMLGKPAADFFAAALAAVGVRAGRAVMVGDDVESDVLGAQQQGIGGILVRTGKFRPEVVDRADGVPDHVVDSFADVPALLGVQHPER